MRASETGGSPVERSRAAKEADDTHATLPPPMTGPQHERSTSERYDAVSQGADMEMGFRRFFVPLEEHLFARRERRRTTDNTTRRNQQAETQDSKTK